MDTEPSKCGKCRNSRPADDKRYPEGWRNCSHLPAAHVVSEFTTCRFTPSKFEQEAACAS